MLVLIVDDDAASRSRRADLLRSAGHEVIEASSPVEAVHWAQNSDIQLLVTEVVLPDQHFGFDLSSAIRERLPSIRTLFTTRYDLAGFDTNLQGTTVVPETATDEEFHAALREVLAAPTATLAEEPPPLMPPGAMLGNYQVINRLYSETDSETYRAMQHPVMRPVALVLLRPHLLTDQRAVSIFKDRERVKASLTHPRIAPLYEAGEANGWLYYTREMPPGESLEEFALNGGTLNERVLVEVLFRAADAMHFGVERGHSYRKLALRDIFVDEEHQASIVNVFRPAGSKPRDQAKDVRSLLDMLAAIAAPGKGRGLLADLAHHPMDWAELSRRMHEIRDDLSARSLLHRAADEHITVAPTLRKRWILLGATCVGIAVTAYLGMLSGDATSDTALTIPEIEPTDVHIRAGEFTFQIKEKAVTKEFWISTYEVTIGQYARFLKSLETGDPKRFDDPLQPEEKVSHAPADWKDVYASASTGGLFNEQPINLNMPIFGVDYWDAVAFAKSVNRRLPTEQEWEKAARGNRGVRYPWGSRADPAAANLGDDFHLNDSRGGSIDGFTLWSPVNLPAGDRSPSGVHGLAGNVQEWTSTWGAHPDVPDKKVPILRGGHFGDKSSDALLTSRHYADSADEGTAARGFRTVSETDPTQTKK